MDKINEIVPQKEWFTLRECSTIKGINYKTFCNRVILQPNEGKPDGYIGGRKSFKRETLLQWIIKSDDEILGGKV
jgi:hypothetical protein